MTTRLAIGVAALVCAAATACGSESTSQSSQRPLHLSIYDGANGTKQHLTIADVVHSSARAESGETAESGVLYFRLTSHGVITFQRLTEALARRGKALHHPLPFTLEIDHRVYARPMVDYRVFPEGLDASQGLQIDGLTLPTARRLAAEIRSAT